MKRLGRIILTAAIMNTLSGIADAAPKPPVDEEALKAWQDMKFGMFIHWGLYSKTAGYWKGRRAKSSGHIMLHEQIPVKEWGALAAEFNPTKFNADAWVLAAKNAGMKYLVVTTKHHDGLAMFNSPSSDFDLTDKSPFKRDPMKELADACHKHGVRLGFYYSLGRDWEDPDCQTNWPKKGGNSNTWDYPDEDAKVFSRYFERKVLAQVRELCTQYGTVDILWFDTPQNTSSQDSQQLRELILSLQPKCIINSRIDNGRGDYEVREQEIGGIHKKPWEACITMARHWNYDLDETQGSYKSAELMVHQLLEIVSKGGNYLLNNGPRPDGTMTEYTLERLNAIGKWMNVNGEGIYGTRPWKIDHEPLAVVEPGSKPNPDDEKLGIEGKAALHDATSKVIPSEVRFTRKGKNLYAFISRWMQPSVLIRSLADGKIDITDITLLGSEDKPKWEQSEKGLKIDLPAYGGTADVPIRGLKITCR